MNKQPRQLQIQSRLLSRAETPGFSLVEMVLAAALLVIATAGTAMLFNISSQQTILSRGKQEQQSAISDDLAAIELLNDRYSCTSGATACAVATTEPGENGYYPTGTGKNASFDALCSTGGLITNLTTAIRQTAVPSSVSSLGITRQAPVVDASDLSSHRYTVTWVDSSNRKLRQTTLVPTVASWCP